MKVLIHTFTLLIICILILWMIIARPFSLSFPGEAHDINSEMLKAEVKKISQDFYPRSSDHPEKLNALSQYIFDRFSQYSKDVEFQEYRAGQHNYRNVIAKFGPSSGSIIVVGAHYDTHSDLPGADDNASGVAALIALSEQLEKLELNQQVQVVAYCLEESPYFATKQMGSFIHASHLKEIGASVELMISLEMLGYFSDEKDSQRYPIPILNFIYPDTGNFIAVVDKIYSNKAFQVKSAINRFSDVEAYSINAPTSLTGVDFSDHRNYWALGFPAVMITDTAFFRNENYHTELDTFDTLDYEKMAEVVYGVFKFLERAESEK